MIMLPSLRSSGEFHSKERGGFTDILQAALHERMEIKLVVASGTSWLTDGASGYVDSMQVIYDWAQAHFFRMGQQGREARSLITCVLFPQPMLPFIKLATEEGKEKIMMTQNSFEATNCARMMVGATCHKSVRSAQSETDLIS